MMQLAVPFCSLLFNPGASILGSDAEVSRLAGAIPLNLLNMEFWSSLWRGHLCL